MEQAITLHPVKSPEIMYQLHHEMMVKKTSRVEQKHNALASELDELNALLTGK